ncbi:MAG: hypothetical protein AVDCRST_MAG73-2646, partial [uncultured Thermomicrobiales bacterium]
ALARPPRRRCPRSRRRRWRLARPGSGFHPRRRPRGDDDDAGRTRLERHPGRHRRTRSHPRRPDGLGSGPALRRGQRGRHRGRHPRFLPGAERGRKPLLRDDRLPRRQHPGDPGGPTGRRDARDDDDRRRLGALPRRHRHAARRGVRRPVALDQDLCHHPRRDGL